MRRTALFVCILGLLGCRVETYDGGDMQLVHMERIPERVNVVVVAPKELAFSCFLVDGKEKHMLVPDLMIDHPGWWRIRSILGGGAARGSAAKSILDLSPGTHTLTIAGAGYQPIQKTITVGAETVEVSIDARELVKDPSATTTTQ